VRANLRQNVVWMLALTTTTVAVVLAGLVLRTFAAPAAAAAARLVDVARNYCFAFGFSPRLQSWSWALVDAATSVAVALWRENCPYLVESCRRNCDEKRGGKRVGVVLRARFGSVLPWQILGRHPPPRNRRNRNRRNLLRPDLRPDHRPHYNYLLVVPLALLFSSVQCGFVSFYREC